MRSGDRGSAMSRCAGCGLEFDAVPKFCPECGLAQEPAAALQAEPERPVESHNTGPLEAESSAIVAPGAGMRATAMVCAALTFLWAVGYVLTVDHTFGGFLVSLTLQPFAWAALLFGYLGDRRAQQYGRCEHCGAPVPAAARVCLKCSRDLDVVLVTEYQAAVPIVWMSLFASTIVVLMLSQAIQ